MKNKAHSANQHNCDDSAALFARRGNFVLGLVGIAFGVATKSPALLADAGHNLGDAAAHSSHLQTAAAERDGKDTDTVKKYQRRAAKIIGAVALGPALFAGYELQQQITNGEPPSPNYLAAAVESASVGFNLYVRRKNKQSPPTLAGHMHSEKHNNLDLKTSTAALGGIVLNPIIPGAESVVGLGISVVTGTFAYKLYKGKQH